MRRIMVHLACTASGRVHPAKSRGADRARFVTYSKVDTSHGDEVRDEAIYVY